jgi:hypothetical protein
MAFFPSGSPYLSWRLSRLMDATVSFTVAKVCVTNFFKKNMASATTGAAAA